MAIGSSCGSTIRTRLPPRQPPDMCVAGRRPRGPTWGHSPFRSPRRVRTTTRAHTPTEPTRTERSTPDARPRAGGCEPSSLTGASGRSILRGPMSSGRKELFPNATDAEWRDWRWQLRHGVRSLAELERYIPLTDDERRGCVETSGIFRLGISPYYLTLIDPDHPYCPVRMQSIPVAEEAHA